MPVQQQKVVYRGERIPQSTAGKVVKVDTNGTERELDKRLDLRNASPTGLNWGYGGSGPTQAAIAILADAYNDDFAIEHHRTFVQEFLTTLEQEEGFTLPKEEIPRYLPADAEVPGGDDA